MKLLDDYFALQRQIFDHFGYVEQWRVFPLEDNTGMPWMLFDEKVAYSDVRWTRESIEAGNQHYSGEIYTQRHLTKHVWRAKDETMVLVNTHTDGNILLMVFDNALECTDAELKGFYWERWGSLWRPGLTDKP